MPLLLTMREEWRLGARFFSPAEMKGGKRSEVPLVQWLQRARGVVFFAAVGLSLATSSWQRARGILPTFLICRVDFRPAMVRLGCGRVFGARVLSGEEDCYCYLAWAIMWSSETIWGEALSQEEARVGGVNLRFMGLQLPGCEGRSTNWGFEV